MGSPALLWRRSAVSIWSCSTPGASIFIPPTFNDVVGYLPLGNYCVVKQSTRKYNGYDWVIFRYQGTEYWTAVIGDRNRVEDCNCDCN